MTTTISGDSTSTFGGAVDLGANNLTTTGNADVGQVVTDAPAFSAVMSANQTPSLNTFTKVVFDTEEYDTHSNYDTTTYRFTPTVAGYYHFNAASQTTTTPSAQSATYFCFYFNGSRGDGKETQSPCITGMSCTSTNSVTFYMNGTTDYVEVFQYYVAALGSQTISSDNFRTYFQGHLVRAV